MLLHLTKNILFCIGLLLCLAAPAVADETTGSAQEASPRESNVRVVCEGGEGEDCQGGEEAIQLLGFVFTRGLILALFVIGGGSFLTSSVASSLKGVLGLDFSGIGQQAKSGRDTAFKKIQEAPLAKSYEKQRQESVQRLSDNALNLGTNWEKTMSFGGRIGRDADRKNLEISKNQIEDEKSEIEKGRQRARGAAREAVVEIMDKKRLQEMKELWNKFSAEEKEIIELDNLGEGRTQAQSDRLENLMSSSREQQLVSNQNKTDAEKEELNKIIQDKRRYTYLKSVIATRVSQTERDEHQKLSTKTSLSHEEEERKNYLDRKISRYNAMLASAGISEDEIKLKKADQRILTSKRHQDEISAMANDEGAEEEELTEHAMVGDTSHVFANRQYLNQNEKAEYAATFDKQIETHQEASKKYEEKEKKIEEINKEIARKGQANAVIRGMNWAGRKISQPYISSKEKMERAGGIATPIMNNDSTGTINSIVSLIQNADSASAIRQDDFIQMILMELIRKVKANGDVSSVTNLMSSDSRAAYAREAHEKLKILGRDIVSESEIKSMLDKLMTTKLTDVSEAEFKGKRQFENMDSGQWFRMMADSYGNERSQKLNQKAQEEDRLQTLSRTVKVYDDNGNMIGEQKVGAVYSPDLSFDSRGNVTAVKNSAAGKYWQKIGQGSGDFTHIASNNTFQSILDMYTHPENDSDLVYDLLDQMQGIGLFNRDDISSEDARKLVEEHMMEYRNIDINDDKARLSKKRQIMGELLQSKHAGEIFVSFKDAFRDYGFDEGDGKSLQEHYEKHADNIGKEDVAYLNLGSGRGKTFIDMGKATVKSRTVEGRADRDKLREARRKRLGRERVDVDKYLTDEKEDGLLPSGVTRSSRPVATSTTPVATSTTPGATSATPGATSATPGDASATPEATPATPPEPPSPAPMASTAALERSIESLPENLKPHFVDIKTAIEDLGRKLDFSHFAERLDRVFPLIDSQIRNIPSDENSNTREAESRALLELFKDLPYALLDVLSTDSGTSLLTPSRSKMLADGFSLMNNQDQSALLNTPNGQLIYHAIAGSNSSDHHDAMINTLSANSLQPQSAGQLLPIILGAATISTDKKRTAFSSFSRNDENIKSLDPQNISSLVNLANSSSTDESIRNLIKEFFKKEKEKITHGDLISEIDDVLVFSPPEE